MFIHSSPQFGEIFMTITLKSLSGKLLISPSLKIFPLWFYLVLSFGTCSLSSFCLTLGVGFYTADETTTSPGLEGVPCVDDESYYPTLPQLFVISPVFVLIQAAYYTLMTPGSCGCAKTCPCP